MVNEDIPVPREMEVDRAIELINRIGTEMAAESDWAARMIDAPHVEGVEKIAEGGITLNARAKVRAGEQWNVAGELRLRVLNALAQPVGPGNAAARRRRKP